MKHKKRIAVFLLAGILCFLSGTAMPPSKIIVDASGKGDFLTIQAAINSLPDSSISPRFIFIRKGRYEEKIFIKKQQLVLEGEDRAGTLIITSIARDEWRCEHPDDWGVATVNVWANDITLKNLTITNNYGFDFTPRTITCAGDSGKQKTIRRDGHQMALRTMQPSTRLAAVNCHFRAFGGDTVSPWETGNGMWYFKDCTMEGGVDFYCPRGWAWAENCEFISHSGPAAIWHDGSGHKDSKTVLINCRFKGFDGFQLGRYHRDAQFYLINCVFAANMKNEAIYRVPTTNTIQWGERIYYYNCHRESGAEFGWYADNLPAGLNTSDITVNWVFGNRWKPVP